MLSWLKYYRVNATRIQAWYRAVRDRNVAVLKRFETYMDSAEAKEYLSVLKAFRKGEGFVLDDDGNSLMHIGARSGSKRVVKLCLKNGHDINSYNNEGETCLHLIAEANFLGQDTLADYLITKGCRVDGANNRGETALMVAARLGHDECVRLFIDCNSDMNHQDHSGYTALHMACAFNRITTVAVLLESGIDCSIQVSVCFSFALSPIFFSRFFLFASLFCRLFPRPILFFVPTINSSTLHQDNEGVTALHDAAGKGYLPVIREVVQYCENLDIQDNTGYTPLHYAVASGHTECADLLFHR